jgi:ATP-dependent 26S proteasome regulatory subunit
MTPSVTQPDVSWPQICQRHLHGELERLRLLLRRRVLWLRNRWQREERLEFKGFAITDGQADRLLGGEEYGAEEEYYRRSPEAQRIGGAAAELGRSLASEGEALRGRGTVLPLDNLVRLFQLSAFERNVLLLCAAPELDSSFERLYGYVQDDATRRYATPELALSLFAHSEEERAEAWERFQSQAPLRCFCLTAAAEPASLASLPLRLSERIAVYLQGFNRLDERAAGLLRPTTTVALAPREREQAACLAKWADQRISQGQCPRLNLVGPAGSGKQAMARAVCDQVGLALHSLELAKLANGGAEQLRLLEREALLLQFALYIDAASIDPAADAAGLRLVEELLGRLRVFLLIGSRNAWRTEWPLLSVPVPRLSREEQTALWREALAGSCVAPETVEAIAEQFDFGPAMISRAVGEARERAGLRSAGDAAVTADDVWLSGRERAGRDMRGLAQRIEPVHTWDDIVVTGEVSRQLREIASQAANRYRVYEVWGFGHKLNRGRGISALFSGPSGTGKTMAAEILAGHLQLDLYRIDLSGVVSKYIGETEKNLRQVFDAAEGSGAILFFDEADALFGKRSEVKDSHDRYANIEINYLLQRMEEYRGLAILATNMKSHLDQAFLRRLRFVVEFRFPNVELRRRIWQKSFPPGTPVNGVMYDLLARLEISGGNIRNIAVNAAFSAAGEGASVGMDHLMRAAAREYMKEERIITAGEFGPYFEELKSGDGNRSSH